MLLIVCNSYIDLFIIYFINIIKHNGLTLLYYLIDFDFIINYGWSVREKLHYKKLEKNTYSNLIFNQNIFSSSSTIFATWL